ncbi:MAG: FolC bifunctional protein [Deltaproteobacteria bacterium SG8_13]|nr:MAG: FolC bifunctional protein [Deltaproteobacteria bacterium SG8_13]
MDAYSRCLDEMFGLRRFGIKLGLDTMRRLLDGLGHPEAAFQAIHVAGTNGKGSVAAMVASVLRQKGIRTGLYTSPHLVRFNERIVIDGRPINDHQVLQAYRRVRSAAQTDREPTFFECTTAMALAEFARCEVEWAIVETGMGGRLDATNILAPALSVITNISLEHREYLGNTIRAIAYEKAGIIKPDTPVVTGIRQPSAVAQVEAAAAKNRAPLFRLGKDFRVRRHPNGSFTYSGIDRTWQQMKTSLAGSHQAENAGLALAACEVLHRLGLELSPDQIRSGLLQTSWPGRLEVVSTEPFVLLDGAHNLTAARNLARHLQTRLSERSITLVVGILDDKPYRGMLQAMVPVCRKVIVTRPRIGRGLPVDTLLQVARKMNPRTQAVGDVKQALLQAMAAAGPNDAVVVAGSLYVVGEAKAALEEMDLDNRTSIH